MIPESPPSFQSLLQSVSTKPERLMELFGVAAELGPLGKYGHWEEIRQGQPPHGLTAAEWWLVIKTGRMPGRQAVPLNDKRGQPFTFSLMPEMFEALQHIDQRCAGSIAMPEQVTNMATRDRYQIASLMEEAVTSSLLEGAAVTREKAREMLLTERKPRNKGERMILNNFTTMQHLRTIKDKPLTPALVLEIHAMISRDTLDKPEAAGRLRRADEHIEIADEHDNVFHIPPAASHLPARLEAMCAFANDPELKGYLHPVIRAIVLHFWLAYDHPFVDGNGRTARALFYWSMLRGGFWLFEYISISQALLRAPSDYYRAFLHTETDENDLNYFILHQLQCIETSIQDLHGYLARKAIERKSVNERLKQFAWLNHRQQALVLHALDHPASRFTFTGHQRSHNTARMTARTDLLSLEEKGLLASEVVGRERFFYPAPDLEARLETRT